MQIPAQLPPFLGVGGQLWAGLLAMSWGEGVLLAGLAWGNH